MADPFSVAGSAVGVVSLGIVLCNSLISYTNTAKDAKHRASQISDRLESLADSLERLQAVTDKFDPSQCTSSTTSAVTSCATAREAVRKVLGKLGGQPQERAGVRGQIGEIKRRLSYPFKQDDILYWKGVLEGVQQDLHTTLLTWGL